VKIILVSAALAILLLGPSLDASEPKHTEAQNDGFVGPIKSVSTRQERAQIEWQQPNGPTIALPVSCWECEYDLMGYRIKSGQIADGEWRGEVVRVLRDSAGNVVEKIAENYKGEMHRRDIIGAYGIVEQNGFESGKQISRALCFYDANGHVSEFRIYNRDGVITSRSFTTTDARDDFKEEWDFGWNGVFSLHFVETNDPKTNTYTFTNLNENGSIKVALTTVGTKLTSYWQEPGEGPLYGADFALDPVGKTRESFACHSDT
jgi:hypothetical protein